MTSHTVAVRTHLEITSSDANVILHKGRKLFELLRMTPDAEKFLEWNPDLAEALEKW